MAATLAPAPRPKAPEKPAAQAAAPPTRVSPPPTRPSMLQTAAPAARLGAEIPSAAPSSAPGLASGGEPLPAAIQAALEQSLQVNLQAVRLHTDAHAHQVAERLSARAVTYGNHIFLGAAERATDLSLIGHEIAHVVQQQGAPTPQRLASDHSDRYEQEAHQASAAVTRHESFTVQERTTHPRVQRLGISDALDYFADAANNIPGFRMFTIILGVNPINMSRVERSAANIMRALVEFLPGGGLITEALDNYGIFDRVGTWVEQQIRSLGMTGSLIKQALDEFLASLSWSDIFDLDGVWERAKRIFTAPIDRIIDFATGLVTDIIKFIKDAILMPLAELAAGTPGWDLLIAVLGENPITGEAVPRTAETLIGGFMKLIGQEEIWNNLQRANAVARAWAWFQGALSGVLGFVRQIPSLFLQALQALELMDIVLLPRAFVKVGRVFAGFLGQFFSWAGQQVLSLLQIIFEVVAPGAVPYIKRAAGAFRKIIENPIGFVGNLVRAGIQGFRQFAANFLTHLRASLVGWLTGTLSGANIYIPQGFNLREIIKFVLSVLGLTWQNIRQKLVRAIGEPAVRALETGFDIVVTLVRQGPAAAWEQIQQGISNLREMVMEEIMTFVRNRVVQAAITRLLTSLNPAGAFIQAIIAIYNTIMFFIERLRQIAQVAMSFIDSIAAIANGVIAAAASRVERTMAGLLTLVISFLARIAGLGRVSDAVVNIINRVRAPIDRALDRVIAWIVTKAKNLLQKLLGKGKEKDKPKDEAIEAPQALAVKKVAAVQGGSQALGRQIADMASGAVIYQAAGGNAVEVTKRVLAAHADAKFEKPGKKLTLPSSEGAQGATLQALGASIAQKTGVTKVRLKKSAKPAGDLPIRLVRGGGGKPPAEMADKVYTFELQGEINPITNVMRGSLDPAGNLTTEEYIPTTVTPAGQGTGITLKITPAAWNGHILPRHVLSTLNQADTSVRTVFLGSPADYAVLMEQAVNNQAVRNVMKPGAKGMRNISLAMSGRDFNLKVNLDTGEIESFHSVGGDDHRFARLPWTDDAGNLMWTPRPRTPPRRR